MKTITQKLLTAAALFTTIPLASAHGVGATESSYYFHYLTSPDHIAVLGTVAVAGVFYLVRNRRRTTSQKQD